MKLKLAIGTITAIFAATAAWAVEYTTSATLDSDVECTALTLGAGCDLDLNGHNLTYNGNNAGFVVTAGAKITNSSATPATVSITSSDRVDYQFQRVSFSGNLALYVKAQTKESAGFQGVNNTHTGGTTLENYNDTNDTKRPRFNTESPFGIGPLVLKGATIRSTYNSTDPWTLANSEVIVEGTGNFLANDNKELKFTKFTMRDGAELEISGNKGMSLKDCNVTIGTNTKLLLSSGHYLHIPQADYSGMELSFHSTSDSNVSTVWFWGAGDLEIRALSTVLEGDTGKNKLCASVEGEHVLRVGGDNSSSTFYGNIGKDTGVWNLTKVGTGTLTLLGENANTGTTTLEDGVLEIAGSGSISATSSIVFKGGTLKYGEGVTTDLSTKVKNSTDFVKVETSGSDITWANEFVLRDNPDMKGIVKSGEGELYLSHYSDYVLGLLESPVYTNRIDQGTLAFKNGRRYHQFDFKAKILGTGTLKFVHFEDNSGYRFRENDSLTEFYGTIDWAGAEQEAANGFMMSGPNNPKMPHLNFLISANPETQTVVMHGETQTNPDVANVEVGAFNHLYSTAALRIDRSAWTLNINGTAGGSYLNGPFVQNAVKIVKTGVGTLKVGYGFSAIEGSTLSVNEGMLELESGVNASSLAAVLTIASGVTLAGEGVFGAVDLSVNDVVAPALTAETDKTTEFTLLTASSITGTSATMTALLNEVNASDKKGKWKLVKKANGDETVTLKCVYSKNAFVVILR